MWGYILLFEQCASIPFGTDHFTPRTASDRISLLSQSTVYRIQSQFKRRWRWRHFKTSATTLKLSQAHFVSVKGCENLIDNSSRRTAQVSTPTIIFKTIPNQMWHLSGSIVHSCRLRLWIFKRFFGPRFMNHCKRYSEQNDDSTKFISTNIQWGVGVKVIFISVFVGNFYQCICILSWWAVNLSLTFYTKLIESMDMKYLKIVRKSTYFFWVQELIFKNKQYVNWNSGDGLTRLDLPEVVSLNRPWLGH